MIINERLKNMKNEGKRLIFRGRCAECGKKVYIIDHHMITKKLLKYLIEVGGFCKKDIITLRNQLKVRICEECEEKFHNGEFYNEQRKRK